MARGFLKLRSDRAYATGGLRTNLDLGTLASKLKRQGLSVETSNGALKVTCDDEMWTFRDWESEGLSRIGWIGMKEMANAAALSHKLAEAGIRHRFEYSRPRDLATNDVRSVTTYDYRWDQPGVAPRGAVTPTIAMYDEQLSPALPRSLT